MRRLIPESVEDFLKIIGNSSRTMEPLEVAMNIAKGTVQQHSVEWIKENGMCLDILRPKKSTIQGAGRGAFAQRHTPKGSLVSPIPLLTILDRTKLNLYKQLEDEEAGEINDIHNGHQLLLNYCFGHRESPLLLCAETNAILINHCSGRNPREGHCGKLGGPNAKIQWGSKWDPDTPEWLNLSLEEITEKVEAHIRGLSFEVIATRDILPGEEVFIDYGERWEIAWDAHVETWESPKNDGTFIPIRTMIDEKDFRTIEELKSNPYPSNVKQVCCFWENEFDGMEDDDIIGHHFEGHGHISDANVGIEREYNAESCEILETTSNGVYSVIIHRYDPSQDVEKTPIFFNNYPEDCISFRLKPGTSDAHQEGVFRHYIEVEDSIFPDQWKHFAPDTDDDSVHPDGEIS